MIHVHVQYTALAINMMIHKILVNMQHYNTRATLNRTSNMMIYVQYTATQAALGYTCTAEQQQVMIQMQNKTLKRREDTRAKKTPKNLIHTCSTMRHFKYIITCIASISLSSKFETRMKFK